MSKYDWTNVDSDVEWIATDEDLNSWGFVTTGEPFVGSANNK